MVRWPSQPLFISTTVYMDSASEALKTSFGESADREAMLEKPCLLVNTQFRCVLSRDAEEALKRRATATKVWPVELFNVSFPEKHVSLAKKKNNNVELPANAVEDAIITRHGVAYVDIADLLYPGITPS